MKWVKVAIGAVIAVSVIPMIALSVINLTQPTVREEIVTFEILTGTTVTSGTWVGLLEIAPITGIGANGTTYYFDGYINNEQGTITIIAQSETSISVQINLESYEPEVYYGLLISNDDTYVDAGLDYSPVVNDTISITGEVTQPPILSGTVASLLVLVPIIFVSGIIYFIYKEQEV